MNKYPSGNELLEEFKTYMEHYPEQEFTFSYRPDGVSFILHDTRKYVCILKNPINSLKGYACPSLRELLEAIVSEQV